MKIIQKRNIYFALSGIFLIISFVFLIMWKLKPGIDFTGGTLMDIAFSENLPVKEELLEEIKKADIKNAIIQYTTKKQAFIRFTSDSDEVNEKLSKIIKDKYPQSKVEKIEFISGIISSELKKKAYLAIILAILGITAYIAWAFRKVSYPIRSWQYGIAAVIALAHDIFLTLGLFAFLGRFYDVEVDVPFIAALLTILGYSVNDTIVVFDRIRENLLRAGSKDDFENTINNSINQTIARSFNTNLTVALVLIAIIFLGGSSIKMFSLALLAGISFGTYSSIFVASALLVEFWKYKIKNR